MRNLKFCKTETQINKPNKTSLHNCADANETNKIH